METEAAAAVMGSSAALQYTFPFEGNGNTVTAVGPCVVALPCNTLSRLKGMETNQYKTGINFFHFILAIHFPV